VVTGKREDELLAANVLKVDAAEVEGRARRGKKKEGLLQREFEKESL